MFSTVLETFLSFSSNLDCCLQTLSDWKSLKFAVWERVKIQGILGLVLEFSFFFYSVVEF